ncbi:MAG: protein-methionine-sulfoxide reductase catalytic subunit MsrP [Deltaproteobacteria bacterium]|nr:protein-methionine-sulfoxide reductase catalytic subunit MsrP [Deltaproteobacteria bacterium]
MLIKKPADVASSELTSEALYLRRREFLAAGVAVATLGSRLARAVEPTAPAPAPAVDGLPPFAKSPLSTTSEKQTSLEDATHYNNYYEFGTSKSDPAENAGAFKPRPWTVKLEGELAKPRTIDLDELMKLVPLEERIYRMRCVEAWSMVIPWVGLPLGALLKKLAPTSKAKFVEFTSIVRPEQMPGQTAPILPWPYVEGLRIDEAMNPLTLLAVGLYGKVLPNQNGAPLRLVVPWKYGFKGIKAIVSIKLTDKQPKNTWNILSPEEYGFYANVNPKHDHPRWSQAKERRIGEFFKRETLMFNGYADQVASLYSGMDLDKNF